MLTIVIETRDHADALARTLSSLVPAAVEGMVREVLVHDLGSTDGTAAVAEHAGCHVVSAGRLGEALVGARGEWLLFLQPGARLTEGWTGAVRDHASGSLRPARFTAERQPGWRGLFGRAAPLSRGLLVPKPEAVALYARHPDPEALSRALRPIRLAATILPVGRR